MQNIVPFGVKISYYAFMAFLLPTYAINYPLANFFNLCDVHLLLVLFSFLTDNNLLISMSAVGTLIAQSLWCLDFICLTVGVKNNIFVDKYHGYMHIFGLIANIFLINCLRL